MEGQDMWLRRKMKNMMVDYLEGSLPEGERKELERCLAQNPSLARDVAEYAKVNSLIHGEERPEISELFWDQYLPKLRKRIELGSIPIPRFEWWPVPVASVTAVLLVIISVLATLSLSESPTYVLEDVPEKTIVAELAAMNSELDYFIVENYEAENIVETFLPQELIYPMIGGG